MQLLNVDVERKNISVAGLRKLYLSKHKCWNSERMFSAFNDKMCAKK